MARRAALGLLAALLTFTALPARAAVTEAWVQSYGPQGDFKRYAQAVVVDGSGNVVVTGYFSTTVGFTVDRCYTVKYASSGSLLWEQQFDGPSSAQGHALAVDGIGNVVVTGHSGNGQPNYDNDFYTAKYAAADGALLWEKRGPSGVASAVAVDGSGNVIVTGRSVDTNGYADFYTAKYAAADGALLWATGYPASDYRGVLNPALAVDASGNAVVTGYCSNTNGFTDYYTAKYAAADGELLWERGYNGPADVDDRARSVAVDANGDVVVTGYTDDLSCGLFICPPLIDYYTAKYAAADGSLLWERRYNGPDNNIDIAQAVAVDAGGNVVVTGYSYSNNGLPYYDSDYYTAKYAAADGALLWEKRYNGTGNYNDEARAVAVDSSGNVVVTGDSWNGISTYYYTAKYAAADGAQLWEELYDNPVGVGAYANGLALGPKGMVAITGASFGYYSIILVYQDPQPPVITCPSNVVTNAIGSGGAVVHFTVTATDESGGPPVVTCAPASGSVFPIGQTTVTCTATDGDGLSSACSFIVTVRGARGAKQGVLAELLALRATVTDRDEGRTLDEAIEHLTHSLAAEFWVDETHLERGHGGKVFHEEKEAVRNLCDLIQSRKSQLSDALLQGFIDQLFDADRLLAFVAIEEAITAGVSGNKIEQARKFLARGDAEAADGKCANGIEEYRKTWKRAARAKVSPPVRLANGRVRLEIAGEPGERVTIQCSSNLKDWVTLGTRTANAEGVVTFEDTDAGPHPTRFYRVLQP